jgi:hypothetical protein
LRATREPEPEDTSLNGQAKALHRQVCEAYGMDADAPAAAASAPAWLSAGVCRTWLEAGVPADFALDVARQDAAARARRGAEPPGAPAWLTPRIMERLQAQRGTVERLKAAAAPQRPTRDEDWYGYCLMLLEDGAWPEFLGASPDSASTACPFDVWLRAKAQCSVSATA